MNLHSVLLSLFVFICSSLPSVRGSEYTECNLEEPKQCKSKAVAVLLKNGTSQPDYGYVYFCETHDSEGCRIVKIQFHLHGLPPGKHGIHVHKFGDTRGGCDSLGPHFNPTRMVHGGRTGEPRHIGDLANLDVDDKGNACYEIEEKNMSLSGGCSVIGKGFVFHEFTDDLGKGPEPGSSENGNSGPRLACGVIGTLNFGACTPCVRCPEKSSAYNKPYNEKSVL